MAPKSTLILIVCLLFVGTVISSEEFTRIQQWNHGEWILGKMLDIAADQDGHLIGGFAGIGKSKLVITPEKALEFAPFGQGPSDLSDFRAVFPYKGDMAIVEQLNKVKIFTKKNGTYVWKETKWFKLNNDLQFVNDGLYIHDHWFFAGKAYYYNQKTIKSRKDKYKYFFIRIFDDKGKPVKELLRGEMADYNHSDFMNYFLEPYQDRLFFAKEDQLKLYFICPSELKELGDQLLQVPSFYKKMPPYFYCWSKELKRDISLLKREHERWQTEYSRVEKMLVEGNYLVLQIRTCRDDMKKFALLFYDAANFSLKKTIFTDDLLLTARNGKYYFFAGGNPSLDEGVDDCIINIYAFEKH